jgi:hypothetical protein
MVADPMAAHVPSMAADSWHESAALATTKYITSQGDLQGEFLQPWSDQM